MREFDPLPEPCAGVGAPLSPAERYAADCHAREMARVFSDPPAWPEWASNQDGRVWTRLDVSDRWQSLGIADLDEVSFVDTATGVRWAGVLEAPVVVPMVFEPGRSCGEWFDDEWRIAQAHPEQEDGVRLYVRWSVELIAGPEGGEA